MSEFEGVWEYWLWLWEDREKNYKRCRKCQVRKIKSEFYKRGGSGDDRNKPKYRCKACTKAYQKT